LLRAAALPGSGGLLDPSSTTQVNGLDSPKKIVWSSSLLICDVLRIGNEALLVLSGESMSLLMVRSSRFDVVGVEFVSIPS
jgi:hypothetical protein